MIVVTGATGNVGWPLVRSLVAAGEQVTAVSRRISAHDVPAGVRHHQADLADLTRLRPALDGADAVFLLTAPHFVAAEGTLRELLGVIRASGVRRVALLSSQGVRTGHHPSDSEDAVTQSGLSWTILRPGNFQSNALQWAEGVRARRLVTAPFCDVALPAIDPADIAEVAAVALRDSAHDGSIYELTGPAAITPRQQATAIGAAIGESVRFVEQTRAEAKAAMMQFMSETALESTLDILGDPADDMQQVSPDVETLLGRPARPFSEWVTRNIAAFA
jgi:uncharacterized protein YbjT (DUF2867 family)